MSDHHDPVARLEAVGRQQPRPLDDDHVAALEARVLAAITTDEPAAGTSVRWAPFALTAAAAIVVLLIVSLVFAGGGDRARFEIADGVVLELPGDSVAAAAGDELPDGAVVAIGVDGLAVIDGERYGPGRYLAADGRLTPIVPSSTSTSSVPTTVAGAPSGATSTTPTSATTSSIPTSSVVDTPVRDTAPMRPPTTRPRERDRPTTTVHDRPTTTRVVDATTVPSTKAPPTSVRDRPRRTTTTTSTTTTTVATDRDR
jgi:hypothetical protein